MYRHNIFLKVFVQYIAKNCQVGVLWRVSAVIQWLGSFEASGFPEACFYCSVCTVLCLGNGTTFLLYSDFVHIVYIDTTVFNILGQHNVVKAGLVWTVCERRLSQSICGGGKSMASMIISTMVANLCPKNHLMDTGDSL